MLSTKSCKSSSRQIQNSKQIEPDPGLAVFEYGMICVVQLVSNNKNKWNQDKQNEKTRCRPGCRARYGVGLRR